MTADDTIDDWTDPYRDVPPPEFEPAPEEFDCHDDVVIPFDRQEREQQREAPAASKPKTKAARPRRLTLTTPDAPMVVARELIEALWTDEQGRETLRYWRGGWVKYTGDCWEHRDKDSVRAEVYRTLEQALKRGADGVDPTPWTPNTKRVNQVMDALTSACHIEVDQEEDRGEYIALRNGLLHLESRVLTPHTPEWFSFTCLPYDYDLLAAPPAALLAFTQSVWGDDMESINLLQEWFGHIVSGSLKHQKLLLLIGAQRAGKGTILKLLVKLVGKRNRAPLTMDALGRQFGLQNAIGKTLGIVGDARQDGRAPALLIERLLMISAGDDIEVDRKRIDPWEGQLAMRLVIASNEVPRLRDGSGALANRFLILNFEKSMLGKEDKDLDDKLAAEMSAIFNWALAGLDRLNEQRRFSDPEAGQEERELLEDLASPIGAFVRDYVQVAAEYSENKDLMFHAWEKWCEHFKHEAGSKIGFTKALKSKVPSLRTRSRGKDGERHRPYFGVRLDPDVIHELGVNIGNGEDSATAVIGQWSDGTPVTAARCTACGEVLGDREHDCPYAVPMF
ncbi:bacteriophage protein [Mycobacteroides abscessus subsp. abscessus]|uniref:DNA primase family protein n=1 Tax=Mycobacteroides abscessus TaxID=36809 RepID=UPI0009A5D131|nr:phage/plasmid primase, P4 family [Mycobacteroides abscessus]SKJ56731.1 bacteriophage protein [Mycobacteroides abscessus subsp. abscessus]